MSELMDELPEELKHWAAAFVAELRAAGWKGELRCVKYPEVPEGGADVVFEWDNDEPPAS